MTAYDVVDDVAAYCKHCCCHVEFHVEDDGNGERMPYGGYHTLPVAICDQCGNECEVCDE